MQKRSHFQTVRLPLVLTLLAAVLLAGCITVLALWCQPNAFRLVVEYLKAQKLLIILNALPVGLLLLVFTCLFRNVFFGAALVNLVTCGFSIANSIKIQVRDEPLFPRDLALLKEVGTIISDYEINFPMRNIAVVLAATLLLIVIGLFVGCKPFPIKKLRGLLGSLLGAAASFAALASLILTVYASNDLYNSFYTTNPYHVPEVFNELGFPYCFCHHFTTYLVDKPEGFSRSEAEEWQNAASDNSAAKPVHVIMVMNEAFSDLTDDPAFTYAEDPLPNLQAMRADSHAITGHLIVPGYAGGTANTEFDVLTGIQTNALSAATTSALRAVNGDLDSLFRVFDADGYHTSFFHPGDDWFYNRENVYRWLGAAETVFADQMIDIEYKGGWVSDDYMADQIEMAFRDAVAEDDLLFHYTTTIQNHMSYTPDKYGEGYEFPPVETSVPLSESVATMLSVYIEGARDADAMLGRLRDYFAAREEPVLLVFFGDHLPSLGEGHLAYAELGSSIATEEMARYKVPYVIWVNEPAAKTLDWESAVQALDLPEHGNLSAAFLGSTVLELTGRGSSNPWFDYLNELRLTAPVVQKQTVLSPDGTILKGPALAESEISPMIEKWRQWSYYKMKFEEFPS